MDKTYSEMCPMAWIEIDGLCVAPQEYAGDCAKQQSFHGSSALEREEVELICGACWPCNEEPACHRDWVLPCPNGYSPIEIAFDEWAATSDMHCAADADVEVQCEARVSFKSEQEKREFVERCGV